jgi:phosphoglycolate phosphatase
MHYSNILFDLDGTLTDPGIGITKSVQFALNKLGIAEEDLSKLEKFIGPPLQESFKQYYSLTDDRAWEAVEYYREYFKARGLYENEIYEGIEQLLQLLKKQGRSLYVATSKPTVFAEEIVSHFHLVHYFDRVHGSELDGTRSDKGELIRHVMETNGLPLTSAVMIGDRKHDIIGAVKNQIHSIGVGYGFGSREELIAQRPTFYYNTVQELTQAFL